MAGPESPPRTPPRIGRPESTSTAVPDTVLIAVTASAPALSAALATSVMSVTFGLSFTNTGMCTRFFTAWVTSATTFGLWPISTPTSFTCGHETFSSTAIAPPFSPIPVERLGDDGARTGPGNPDQYLTGDS